MSDKVISLSAILITKNEEANIRRCLDALQWLPEVVIVDSKSEDKTVEIAQSYPNTKVIISDWLGFSPTKRLATKAARNNWILWIDADEVVSPALQKEISFLFADNPPNDFVAASMPRKTFFLGEWVKHSGWYPGRVIRLFNRHHCDFNDNHLHEGIEVPANKNIKSLRYDILHYSYTSLYQYFDKMNYYGRYGAEELKRRGKKPSLWKLLLSPLAGFIKTYLLNQGFRDGRKGLIIAVGTAFSTFIKYSNFWYLYHKGRTDQF